MMTNVSFASSTLWFILTSSTQEDAWGQSKNRYLAKRREVPAWGMGQHVEREAGFCGHPQQCWGVGIPTTRDGSLWMSAALTLHAPSGHGPLSP